VNCRWQPRGSSPSPTRPSRPAPRPRPHPLPHRHPGRGTGIRRTQQRPDLTPAEQGDRCSHYSAELVADSSAESAAEPQSSVPKIRSLSVMATVPSSWPPAGCWWPSTLDGGEGRRKIEQPRRAGCSRSLAETSSCSPADGSSYNEVANSGSAGRSGDGRVIGAPGAPAVAGADDALVGTVIVVADPGAGDPASALHDRGDVPDPVA